jgi:hypothetical protein
MTGLVPNSMYSFTPTEAQTYHADPPYVEPVRPPSPPVTKEQRIANENEVLKRMDETKRLGYEQMRRDQQMAADTLQRNCQSSGNPNGFACRAHQDFIHSPYDPAGENLQTRAQQCASFGGMTCKTYRDEVNRYPMTLGPLPPLVR